MTYFISAELTTPLEDVIFADTKTCPINEHLGTFGTGGILAGVPRNVADVNVFEAVFVTDFLGPF